MKYPVRIVKYNFLNILILLATDIERTYEAILKLGKLVKVHLVAWNPVSSGS